MDNEIKNEQPSKYADMTDDQIRDRLAVLSEYAISDGELDETHPDAQEFKELKEELEKREAEAAKEADINSVDAINKRVNDWFNGTKDSSNYNYNSPELIDDVRSEFYGGVPFGSDPQKVVSSTKPLSEEEEKNNTQSL